MGCLLVGMVVHRQFSTVEVSLTVSAPFSRYISRTEFFQEKVSVEEEKIVFSEMKFEEEKKVVVAKTAPKPSLKVEPKKREEVKISIYSLPFEDSFKVKPVYLHHEMNANLVALYKEFKFNPT